MTCPIVEVIWAYRASGATSEHPEAFGEVWVDRDGTAKAQGGDRDLLLTVFKARRQEIIDWITTPCVDCGDHAGADDALPSTGERICRTCFAERAKLLVPGGLFDQGVIDVRGRRTDDPDGPRVAPSDYPTLVARDGTPLPQESNVVPFPGPKAPPEDEKQAAEG